ncbi:MAG: methanogenesis marker protein 11 [Candidatus Roizmanbacteria bacterium]
MIYTPSELRDSQKDKPWVMSYNRLEAIADPTSKKVMYIENYGPHDGFFIEGWRALHYPRTSPLVQKSYREGGSTICIIKTGKSDLKLVPSLSPLGISECKINGDEIEITFEGVGGAGVSASYSRGMAEGVKRVEVISGGGGRKMGKAKIILPKKRLLLIGVDDTDNDEEGATYSLVHNIATEISSKSKTRYAIHVNVQLYPYNDFKTKNCFATVVGIIFENDKEKAEIISHFQKQLKKYSVSKETGMAVYEGFSFDKDFEALCTSLKFQMLEDTQLLISEAKKQGVEVYEITGKRGLVGAIGSLPFFDKPDFAATLPPKK